MNIVQILIWLIFIIWALLCIKSFYNATRGIGTDRIDNIFLSYRINDNQIKICLFNIFCLRRIYIADIEQILPLSELKNKANILLRAEHWEHRPFKPMVCIQSKEKNRNKWLLLSPTNIHDFINTIKETSLRMKMQNSNTDAEDQH